MGGTPLLRVPLSRDHLSVVSAITPNGRLFTLTQERAFKGPDFVRFHKHLLRHLPGKLLVIWDGLPAHRSTAIRDFLAQGAAERIHLERWPGYAPDLNPDEGVWRYLKQVALRNCCCLDLAHLCLELRTAIARCRHQSHLLHACFRRSFGDNFTLSCSGQ